MTNPRRRKELREKYEAEADQRNKDRKQEIDRLRFAVSQLRDNLDDPTEVAVWSVIDAIRQIVS